jgi:hypothetical protein
MKTAFLYLIGSILFLCFAGCQDTVLTTSTSSGDSGTSSIRVEYASNGTSYNKSAPSITCLGDSVTLSLELFRLNEKDTNASVQWTFLNEGIFHEVEPFKKPFSITESITLYSSDSGDASIEIEVVDSTVNHTYLKDTLIFPVRSDLASGCLVVDSTFMFQVGEQILLPMSDGTRRVSIRLGDSVHFFAHYILEEEIADSLKVVWNSTDRSILGFDQDTSSSQVIRGLQEGTSVIRFEAVSITGDVIGIDSVLFNVGLASRVGSFIKSSAYGIDGDFVLSETSDGSLSLLFESNFTFSGAPGPVVYLSNSNSSISGAAQIGTLDRNGANGTMTFAVPENISLSQYKYVVLWCEPFGITLGWGSFSQ